MPTSTNFEVLVNAGASDLHLGEGQPPKIRRHGDIMPIRESCSRATRWCHDERNLRPGALGAFRGAGDLDFAYEMDEHSRFRCNFLKQTQRLRRGLPAHPDEDRSLEQLGIPPVVKEFGHLRGGLVLVTGPTGSGKSTTLAALIDYINANFTRHIITIEEPIEFVHNNKRSIITQREVPEHSATFPAGPESRPARGLPTSCSSAKCATWKPSQLALTAAETGLLVFGTLHTNNARKTVDRMIDVFPADQQAAGAHHARQLAARRRRPAPAQARGRRRPSRRERNPRSSTARSPPSSAKAPRRSSRT